MHTLSELEPGIFSVGYFHPDTEQVGRSHSEVHHRFIPLFSYKTAVQAAAAVNFLNGGDGRFPSPQPHAIMERMLQEVKS